MPRIQKYEKDITIPTVPEKALVINIEGATAKNNATAENSATNINVLQGTGQTIEIEQNASAVVNNMTAIIIGPPYPLNFILNDDNKTLNLEIIKDGQVKINGEEMEIKELSNGVKVMFLQKLSKDSIINNKEEKNLEFDSNNRNIL